MEFLSKKKHWQKVDKLLDRTVRDIWGYVRNSRDNLDSERGCNKITYALHLATSGVWAQVDLFQAETKKYVEKNKQLKNRLQAQQKKARDGKRLNKKFS